jgi:hypothetical protein
MSVVLPNLGFAGAPVQIDREIWDVSSCAIPRLEWDAWLPKYKAFWLWKRDLFQGS